MSNPIIFIKQSVLESVKSEMYISGTVGSFPDVRSALFNARVGLLTAVNHHWKETSGRRLRLLGSLPQVWDDILFFRESAAEFMLVQKVRPHLLQHQFGDYFFVSPDEL